MLHESEDEQENLPPNLIRLATTGDDISPVRRHETTAVRQDCSNDHSPAIIPPTTKATSIYASALNRRRQRHACFQGTLTKNLSPPSMNDTNQKDSESYITSSTEGSPFETPILGAAEDTFPSICLSKDEGFKSSSPPKIVPGSSHEINHTSPGSVMDLVTDGRFHSPTKEKSEPGWEMDEFETVALRNYTRSVNVDRVENPSPISPQKLFWTENPTSRLHDDWLPDFENDAPMNSPEIPTVPSTNEFPQYSLDCREASSEILLQHVIHVTSPQSDESQQDDTTETESDGPSSIDSTFVFKSNETVSSQLEASVYSKSVLATEDQQGGFEVDSASQIEYVDPSESSSIQTSSNASAHQVTPATISQQADPVRVKLNLNYLTLTDPVTRDNIVKELCEHAESLVEVEIFHRDGAMDSCDATRIGISYRHLLQAMCSKLPHLQRLHLFGFEGDVLEECMSALHAHPTLTVVHLSIPKGTVNAATLRALTTFPNLAEVEIHVNESFPLAVLLTSRSLRSFQVGQCVDDSPSTSFSFDDNHVFQFIVALARSSKQHSVESSQLQSLDLKPSISPIAFQALVKALRHNTCLESVRVSFTGSLAEIERSTEDVLALLRCNSTLKCLWNHQAESVKISAIAEGFILQSLKKANLECFQLFRESTAFSCHKSVILSRNCRTSGEESNQAENGALPRFSGEALAFQAMSVLSECAALVNTGFKSLSGSGPRMTKTSTEKDQFKDWAAPLADFITRATKGCVKIPC
jgi:hypothetical protein